MPDKEYPLDKSAFRAMTFREADDHVTFWNDKNEEERLNAACFLINQIYGVTRDTKIDFSITDKRKNN